MILPKNSHLTARASQRVTIEEQAQFNSKGGSDGKDRRQVKLVGFPTCVLDDNAEGLDNDHQVNGAHPTRHEKHSLAGVTV